MFKKILGLLGMTLMAVSFAMGATKVTIETSQGNIELLLDEAKAPKTVANFIQYADSGFYNGTIFHRVIDGFMIQGGGFDKNMKQKSTKPTIPNEANNGLKNTVGTIAMARTNAPHSATAQFFINVANNTSLDYRDNSTSGYGYAVFGRVTKGMNVVNKIAKTQTGSKAGFDDVPADPIIINKVTVYKNK